MVPEYVCCCCQQLHFQYTMQILPDVMLEALLPEVTASFINSRWPDGNLMFCSSCAAQLRANRIPAVATVNGVGFPELPPEIKCLTEHEARLVAARQHFMQVQILRKTIDMQGLADQQYYQKGIKGSIINVPFVPLSLHSASDPLLLGTRSAAIPAHLSHSPKADTLASQ